MKIIKHFGHRMQQMIANNKYVKMDSKFLVLSFVLCFFVICISSFSMKLSENGNLTTIRTLFSSLLGFIIENVSREKKDTQTTSRSSEEKTTNAIGFQDDTKPTAKNEELPTMRHETEEEKRNRMLAEEIIRTQRLGEIDQGPRDKIELRVLLIGHVVFFSIIALVIGGFFGVEQNNQSLTVLRNTVFACVGFLISAAKSRQE